MRHVVSEQFPIPVTEWLRVSVRTALRGVIALSKQAGNKFRLPVCGGLLFRLFRAPFALFTVVGCTLQVRR